MKAFYLLALLSYWASSDASVYYVLEGSFTITDKYPGGFTGRVDFPVVRNYRYGWLLNITFDIEIDEFNLFEGRLIGSHPSKKYFIVSHEEYNLNLHRDASGMRKMFCEGKCVGRPSANIRFIPLMDATETMEEALLRAEASGITGDTLPDPTALPAGKTTGSFLEEWLPPDFDTDTPTTSTTTTTTRLTTQISTTTLSPPPPNLGDLNLRYNLRDLITKSLLFFEAQRSGVLPDSNRIKWRSHSALKDGIDHLVDLSGGYYTDGGFIKYNFPMAFSTTMLAWGVLEFRNAYLASHQIPHVMNALRWTADYFLKCHVSPFVFYAQVSTSYVDSSYWGRPEQFVDDRPSFRIDRRNPGSDLAAEAAAALAATAIIFNGTNSTYSSELIMHAEQLYRLAVRYPGKYSDSIPEAQQSYKSWNGYYDELAWGALWLYKATKKENYITLAKKRFETNADKSELKLFSWDDKRAGVLILLAQITGDATHSLDIASFCDSFLLGRGTHYTPRGLAFLDEWGPLRHAANAGVICLLAANLNIRPDIYRQFAHGQLAYMLGGGGRSFVVGFGENPPTRPYHRASSCPALPAPCTWSDKDADRPNPQQLTGALVGGPDKWDSYSDNRTDYKGNSVALDYNAALQTLAAGILELQVTGETFSEPNPQELNTAVSESFSVKHDYGEVLHLSLLFYEAQRSGKLPNDNSVPWRRSAFTDDVGHNGTDLSGGYHDAGDYVKFNFPMAYTITVLSWGMLQYRDAYESTGEMNNALKAIRWATDYFIKCHTSKHVVYGQVGSGVIDHGYWLRPDQMELVPRPAFDLTRQRPGTEVAAEMAAAMAAASLLFRDADPEYAKLLVAHAKDLHEFADRFREKYHRSIQDARRFYSSISGFEDELVWSALWLYSATGDRQYVRYAQINYKHFRLHQDSLHSFFWDEKTAGIQLILAQTTQENQYRVKVQQFCDSFLEENGHKYTPKGLVYINDWGPLRHAAGVAFICLGAANIGIRPERYRDFARRQIHYMLGDSGLGSYLIGYGPVPPTRPHHRASSCPSPPAKCGFSYLHTASPNPHLLRGALVGGPDINDRFFDKRSNHKSNEVALDYNAAFQSAVAALKYLELYPPITTTSTFSTTTTTTAGTTEPAYAVEEETESIEDLIDSEEWFFGQGSDDVDTTASSVASTQLDITTGATLTNLTTFVTDHTPPHAETTSEETTRMTTASMNVESTVATTARTTMKTEMTTVPNEAVDLATEPTDVIITTELDRTTQIPSSPSLRVIRLTTPSDKIYFPKWVQYPAECRPVDVFDVCSIDKRTYHRHEGKEKFYCRYHAFQHCVNQQGVACEDDLLWINYPYWNSRASDHTYFTVDDERCKNPNTVAVEKCLLRGVTYSLGQCFTSSGRVNESNMEGKQTPCRWTTFRLCVGEKVGHCPNTWSIWRLWNTNLGTPYFNSTEVRCGNSSNRASMPTLTYAICCVFISFLFAIMS